MSTSQYVVKPALTGRTGHGDAADKTDLDIDEVPDNVPSGPGRHGAVIDRQERLFGRDVDLYRAVLSPPGGTDRRAGPPGRGPGARGRRAPLGPYPPR